MFYYEVATAGNTRGKTSIFTYEYSESLETGTIVSVNLKNKMCLGFIVKKSAKPTFKTNPLTPYQPYTVLPPEVLSTFQDLIGLYPLSESQIAGLFTPPPAAKKPESIDSTDTSKTAKDIPDLNNEQSDVFKTISSGSKNTLLFGDTGTGKTRIYQHLIKKTLDSGKNVILLTPEIGLASYLHKEMIEYFPGSLLYHSNLAPKMRSTIWQRSAICKQGALIIGPRSALGLPLGNVGMIILDEAHDASYRQDGSPYLHAKVLAAVLAKHHGAQCVYGTATPSIADYYYANELKNPIVKIDKRAVVSDKLATVKILDYADDRQRNKGSILKSSLTGISSAIKKGGQALVLVNRRGTARYVACDSCGKEQRCKTCDHLTVYHHDSYELRCHFCNSRYPVPSQCSECGSFDIKMRSFGTKAIAEELSKAFPDVSLRRFDTDTGKKDHLNEHTESLKDGSVQIIVGTQMIAKGLDLPMLKALVVLSGASSGGFGSEERDFQLLYQVIGRAMRGHQDTEVIIQTATPDSKILSQAINRDYQSFYDYETSERKKFSYPPYCHMMIVHISRKSAKSALSAGASIQKKISNSYGSVSVSSPIPDMTERIGENYHWHLLVRSSKRSRLTDIAKDLGTGCLCELDPIDTP